MAKDKAKNKAEINVDNRRPLKVRSHKWANRLAVYLAARYVTPNQISLMSMAFAAIAMLGAMLWNVLGFTALQVFLLLFVIIGVQGRLLCNLLDGMVAIEGGRKTPAGELYNDIPDRISDALIFIGLGVGLASMMPFALELGFLAALFAVLTAYVRVLGVSLGAPAYFCGPMAKQHRMALVTAGAVLTIVSLFYAQEYSAWIFYMVLIIITVGSAFTCVRRIMKIKVFMEEWTLQENSISAEFGTFPFHDLYDPDELGGRSENRAGSDGVKGGVIAGIAAVSAIDMNAEGHEIVGSYGDVAQGKQSKVSEDSKDSKFSNDNEKPEESIEDIEPADGGDGGGDSGGADGDD